LEVGFAEGACLHEFLLEWDTDKRG
jgi:hypothetical protein